MSVIKSQTHLAKWGNSKAARIPMQVVNDLNLKENQLLDVTIKGNSIILTPQKKKPSDIHELFSGWKDDGIRETEVDWGNSIGEQLPW